MLPQPPIPSLLLTPQDKKELAGNEAVTNDTIGYAFVENFALKVFLNADNEDRSGKASGYTSPSGNSK